MAVIVFVAVLVGVGVGLGTVGVNEDVRLGVGVENRTSDVCANQSVFSLSDDFV